MRQPVIQVKDEAGQVVCEARTEQEFVDQAYRTFHRMARRKQNATMVFAVYEDGKYIGEQIMKQYRRRA